MSDIIRGQTTKGTGYFCPKCNSPDLNLTSTTWIMGAKMPVHCGSCGWDGDQDELVQASFSHEFKSEEEIVRAMTTDLRNLLAKTAGVTYGSFLMKWGFLEQPVQSSHLARYLMNIASAVLPAILETRRELAKEAAGGRPR